MHHARIWLALGIGALCLCSWSEPSEAQKRRPNGCDWIGGDFAEPGEVIFNTGCRKATPHNGPSQPKDEPPKPIDRPDARAPLNFGATTRKSIGSGIEGFEIVGGTVAYALDGTAHLWRTTLGAKDSAAVAESVIAFKDVASGPLFVLEKDRTLWRVGQDGSDKTFVDHEVQDFQPLGDFLYLVGTDKRLWRLHPDGKTRDHVDDSVAAFQAIDARLVFVLGTDGTLWRETDNFQNRVKVGKPITAFNYVPDGDATYVLTPNHILWRQKASGIPEPVDHDVAAFHAVDKDLVYVLGTDGRLWQELGNRSQAALVDGDLALKLGPNAFQFASAGDVQGQSIYLLDRKHELWAEIMPSARPESTAR